MRFYEFFRDRREQIEPVLKDFAELVGMDTGNLSKLERGLIDPPKWPNVLNRHAEALQLRPLTPEWYLFFDLAYAENGRIPSDCLSEEIFDWLPTLFCLFRGHKVEDEKYKEFVKFLGRNQ